MRGHEDIGKAQIARIELRLVVGHIQRSPAQMAAYQRRAPRVVIDQRAARVVLVVGVEKMTDTQGPEVGQNLLKASDLPEEGGTPGGFAGVSGSIADAYFQRCGDQSDALARIAAKNHRNGVDNPFAQIRRDPGNDFCRTESEKNLYVAGPLKRTDYSPASDGAAALVLADTETALCMRRSVIFRANEQVNDVLPISNRDGLMFEGCSEVWTRAFRNASLAIFRLSGRMTVSPSPN